MPSKRPLKGASTIAHLRLANQRIVGSAFATPVEVVRWMLAMQAQDFAGAKWSIALRTAPSAPATDADVEAAIAAGSIVRSWPMRGTLHFTAAEDLPWMLALTTARLVAAAAKRRASLDLDLATLEHARAIAATRLSGGRSLTREQLLSELDQQGVSTAGQRGYHILWHLSQTGTLCCGPTDDKAQTFVLLHEWIKRPRQLERAEALGELARRYFAGHGPATLKDFLGWTKLTAGDAKIGLAVAKSELKELTVDGVSYWMAANAETILSSAGTAATRSTVLLPGFDEYILGYQDRSAVLAKEHTHTILPGGNGVFMPTMVVDGKVVGTWRRDRKARETLVTFAPFAPLPSSGRAALARAVQAYGRFLGVVTRCEGSD